MRTVLLCLCTFGCASYKGRTIDLLEGTYEAVLPEEADLKSFVHIDSDKAKLVINFADHDGSLWADVDLLGEYRVYGIEIDESEAPTIKDVSVDGRNLITRMTVEGITVDVTGWFSCDMTELDLTVDRLGDFFLTLVPEAPAVETEEVS